jgi:hypothetical protein
MFQNYIFTAFTQGHREQNHKTLTLLLLSLSRNLDLKHADL